MGRRWRGGRRGGGLIDCDPCSDKVNILNEKRFNINPHTNIYFVYCDDNTLFVINEVIVLLIMNKICPFCNLFIIEFLFFRKKEHKDFGRP